ncbi:MAG: oligosaccharide flippase family protein [Bacteroidia bacterium]
MLNNIIQTVLSKGLISILNFLVVVITAKYTGAEGRGEISMMYLNVTVVLLINDLIGGGAVTFLTPRHHFLKLTLLALTWAIICGLLFPILLNLYLNYDRENLCWFILLSLSLNLSSCCNALLNGKEKIRQNNFGNILQTISLFAVLLFFIFIKGNNSPGAYFAALLVGYNLNLLASLFFLRKDFTDPSNKDAKDTLNQMFVYGMQLQWGNVVQLLNYRLGYYFINSFFIESGKKMVGIYSTATSVTEAVWVIMNGISMVQYAKISNSQDKDFAKLISAKLARLSFMITLLAILVLNFLPLSVFTFLFGEEFVEVKQVILLLSPGIALLGLTGIYAHYFAGLGLMKISSMSAMLGFAVTLVSGFILIPRFNIFGAAVSASLSYFASGLFLVWKFREHSGLSLKNMFTGYKDLFKLN